MDSGYLVKGNLNNYLVVLSGLLDGVGRICEIISIDKEPEEIMKYYREAIGLLLQGIRTR
ncbi:hypothetical protein D3C71_1805800 [compost metagenome]